MRSTLVPAHPPDTRLAQKGMGSVWIVIVFQAISIQLVEFVCIVSIW